MENETIKIQFDFGNIKDIDQQGNNTRDIMMNVNYLLWSPFDHKKCLECNILPICMGGAPITV